MSKLKHESIISKMTLKEKASLMSGKNFWETQNIDKLGIPSIFLADGPHGIRKQVAAADHLGLNESTKATCFPTASALSSSWNVDLANKIGVALGKEARYQDVNVLLGPGMNTKRNVLCGRNFEYFSEDPYLGGKIAANLVKGIQNSGVSACLKHFACNSQEFRRMNVDSVVDERALREIYLTNFEIAVKEGKPNCIMSSYNLVNGQYANENQHLSSILHDEWGYDGVVVTDWGGDNDRIKGLLAGNQLEMPTTAGDTNRDIVKAVEEGRLDEKKLDESVDKLLDLIFKTQKEKGKDYSIDLDEHNSLATKAAEESIVLLENDNVLPLNTKDKVSIIGRFAEQTRYQGAGSSKVNSYKVDKLLDILPNYKLNFIGYEPGFKFNGKISKSLIKKASDLASKSDVVLMMLGLDELSEAEGIDRESMKLPNNQLFLLNEILKLGKKVVVCLCTGSAIEIPFADKVNGLIHYHLCGQAAVDALLNVVTGKVNPSGKLSESYPIKYEDNPTVNYFHKKENTADYKESIYVGYRYYSKNNIKVRYPFGYGKSYTTFAYSDLLISDNQVSFKITNTGSIKGKEVCQLYISKEDSKIYRASKELKGFSKVELDPNETKTVAIPFDEFSFRFFNTKSGKWEIEGGMYEVLIGSSSEHIVLNGNLSLEGNMSEPSYNLDEIPSYFSGKVNNVSDKEFEIILGRKIPNGDIKFINKKKNRINVDIYTTVAQLKYAKGWSGRFFSGIIRFAIKFLKLIGQGGTANTLIMGVYHQPMRGMSRMTGGIIHWEQLNGLIVMFNGKFFKGLHIFFKEGRKLKKIKKAEKSI